MRHSPIRSVVREYVPDLIDGGNLLSSLRLGVANSLSPHGGREGSRVEIECVLVVQAE